MSAILEPSPRPVVIPVRSIPTTTDTAHQCRSAWLRGIADVCEVLDEILFEDEGDALATIAPWLVANGIAPSEVQS